LDQKSNKKIKSQTCFSPRATTAPRLAPAYALVFPFARLPGTKARWSEGMCVEASLCLDLFGSFSIKGKRTYDSKRYVLHDQRNEAALSSSK
jgi:hypothetical protein